MLGPGGHEFAGYADTPSKGEASKALRGHRRREADRNRRPRKAEPLTIDRLRDVVAPLDPTRAADARDRGAPCPRFRRLPAPLQHRRPRPRRPRGAPRPARGHIRRSKTDQEARGRVVEIPLGSDAAVCPVHALEACLAHSDEAGHTDGPVFRPVDLRGRIAGTRLSALSAHSASTVAAKRAHVAGLTEATRSEQGRRHYSRQFTGHSLRAGAATSMAKAGAVTAEIAEHGGWSAKSSVVHEYVRRRVLASQPHAQRALNCH